MELTSLGDLGFRLKGKTITVLVDPTSAKEKADMAVFSGATSTPHPTLGPASRDKVFVIEKEGEYEIGGVGVISERAGERLFSTVMIDGVSIAHLSDGNFNLTDKQIERLNEADVILVPTSLKAELVGKLEPYIMVIMGYKSEDELTKFVTENKLSNLKRGEDKLKLDADSLPEDMLVMTLNG